MKVSQNNSLEVGRNISILTARQNNHFSPKLSAPDSQSLASTSDTMYSWISFREATPPQNRQLNILISNSHQ